MCVENSSWRSRPECLVEGLSATAGVGVFQSLWEKADLGGACGLTWNVPGKYKPHSELFFFLIQKEPATVPVSETFSPCSNAEIRTPSSLLMSKKKRALIALHVMVEEGRDGDGCHVPCLGDERKMGCLKSPMFESGRRILIGRRTCVLHRVS